MDTVDQKTRSRIMSSVGQKNTAPEKLLRSALHRRGLRFRLHDRKLPGSPDLVFPKYRAAVFVHGCFWHAHGCYRSTKPKTRAKFWQSKFEANRQRDSRIVARLRDKGWRVLTVWECILKGKTARPVDAVAEEVDRWLNSGNAMAELSAAAYPSGNFKVAI
ncbi:very short patch repair endonuclease [Tsuneonella sp. HG094]